VTLPSSGAITLADIQTEFGGSNPISLSEYYAGGAYVPSGTTGTNGPVPSSGPIDVNVFHGTSAAESHTLTQGTFADKFFSYYGYSTASSFGSISPTTSAKLGGATISECYWYTVNVLVFTINAIVAQSAFTTLTIGATGYATASAGFSAGGGVSTWTWSEPSNPFPTAGTYTVKIA